MGVLFYLKEKCYLIWTNLSSSYWTSPVSIFSYLIYLKYTINLFFHAYYFELLLLMHLLPPEAFSREDWALYVWLPLFG